MEIMFRGIKYTFRKCDVRGMTKSEVEAAANERGHIQYDPSCVWLYVPGIGYGVREDYY